MDRRKGELLMVDIRVMLVMSIALSILVIKEGRIDIKNI